MFLFSLMNLSWVDLGPGGHLTNSGDILVVTNDGGATGI